MSVAQFLLGFCKPTENVAESCTVSYKEAVKDSLLCWKGDF